MNTQLLKQFMDCFPEYRKALVKNLFLLVHSIISARSTNLMVVKDQLGALLEVKGRKPESHYKRLIRFFRFAFPQQLCLSILQFSYRLLCGRSKYLILDSTCWAVGQKWIHLQVLCIVIWDTAIPIYWRDLDHKGHSNTKDRINLIKEAANLFDLKGKILLADREYAGDDWLQFLNSIGIEFIIRLAQTCYKKQVYSHGSLEKKAMRRKRAVATPILWEGYNFQLVIKKNPDPKHPEKLLYWITSLQDPISASEQYRQRWKIERCFKCLKSNGFNLQLLNFQKVEKVHLMVALVVLAYVICLIEGFKSKYKVGMKKYKSGRTGPALSYFRFGLQEVLAFTPFFKLFLALVFVQLYACRSRK